MKSCNLNLAVLERPSRKQREQYNGLLFCQYHPRRSSGNIEIAIEGGKSCLRIHRPRAQFPCLSKGLSTTKIEVQTHLQLISYFILEGN